MHPLGLAIELIQETCVFSMLGARQRSARWRSSHVEDVYGLA
jgi:hypothetical protein